MGDSVEVVEGDGGAGVFMVMITAFHGEDDGFGAVAEVGQLLAGEFVKDAQDGEFLGQVAAAGLGWHRRKRALTHYCPT